MSIFMLAFRGGMPLGNLLAGFGGPTLVHHHGRC